MHLLKQRNGIPESRSFLIVKEQEFKKVCERRNQEGRKRRGKTRTETERFVLLMPSLSGCWFSTIIWYSNQHNSSTRVPSSAVISRRSCQFSTALSSTLSSGFWFFQQSRNMHSAHIHIMFFVLFFGGVFSLVEAANVSAFFNKQT